MFEELVDLPQYSGLNDQVYEALRNAILQEVLPAGCKLDVNLLAKRWGVSRTPVNDAIQRLMTEGLVTVVPRRGTFVARVEAKDILEFMDVRLMFELRAAELCIGRISRKQLDELKGILLQMDELLKAPDIDYIHYGSLDRDQHALPIRWTNNQKLYEIYQAQNIRWCITRPPKSFAGQAEHWDIYKAYEAGSLDAARAAITRHIEAGKARVLELSKG